ncbi:hypothetical protein Misp01_07110 [Microtetraspora sp. NBRC 13810]|nr:hypothetical protein Misp01_07110 [Microtetraspora sp. NBRC 13810]
MFRGLGASGGEGGCRGAGAVTVHPVRAEPVGERGSVTSAGCFSLQFAVATRALKANVAVEVLMERVRFIAIR